MSPTAARAATGRRAALVTALAVPEEPEQLLESLRSLAVTDPAAARDELAGRVADYLWGLWGPALEGLGLEQADVRGVADGYGRELWLWLAGERTWQESGSGLAGRLVRRAR